MTQGQIPRWNLALLALIFAIPALVGMASAQTTQPDPFANTNGICGTERADMVACDAIRRRAIVDPLTPPYSVVGRLNFASTDIRSHCTGVLVSDHLALTAAHCLWNSPRMRWIPNTSLRFVTGYQHGRANAVAHVTDVITAPALNRTANFAIAPPMDWALLVLDTPLGANGNHVALFSGKLRLAGPGHAVLVGYAGLTSHVLSRADDCGRPLTAAGRLMAHCSAMPGDSGAPLFWLGADGLELLGIATAIHAASGQITTDFAPWFRLREAIAGEIAKGH